MISWYQSVFALYPTLTSIVSLLVIFLLIIFAVFQPIHKAEIRKGKDPEEGGLAAIVSSILAVGSIATFLILMWS